MLKHLLLFLLICPALSFSQESDFDTWLGELRAEAVERGFSEEAIESAFSEISAPVQRIVTNDRNQAEVVQTYADYLAARVSEWKEVNGKSRIEENQALLDEIEQAYGVQARFIVSIWGMETNFGTFPIRESVFSALATLAYDRRRADYFRAEFFSALEILDSGFPSYEQMKSSWAGAMGQSQFMPGNYLRYAVDFDGDGRRDIWNNEADVLASIANYLSSFGWSSDETWGRPVTLPTTEEGEFRDRNSASLEPDQRCRRYRSISLWKDLQEWQELGVRRADGSDLPDRSIPAALITADSGDGEAYLVYRNFCSIMRFNPALKYALSIGLLSDLLESN